MATQIAVAAGAMVIGTVGTRGKEKRALAFGAARVINRDDEDFVAATLAFTGGKLVDKIVDSTGASILDRSFAAIRNLGHVVSYGEAEGRPFPDLWQRLVTKSLTFTRFHLGHVDFQGEIVETQRGGNDGRGGGRTVEGAHRGGVRVRARRSDASAPRFALGRRQAAAGRQSRLMGGAFLKRQDIRLKRRGTRSSAAPR